MPSTELAEIALPASSHIRNEETLRSETDLQIFRSYLLSKTLSHSNMKVPLNFSSAPVSRHSSIIEAADADTFSEYNAWTAPEKPRRMSLPGGTEKLRQMVFQRVDVRKQFSYLDFESHVRQYTKRHQKTVWEKFFNKSTMRDTNANLVKKYGILEILSSKIASLYFLAFLLERGLESTALFIWDCLRPESEAPMTTLVHDYCLKDSPLLLPQIENVNYEKIASQSLNRDDLIISVSRAISPLLIAAYDLFLGSTLFLSFESLGKQGSYTKKDQDIAVKTLARYLGAYSDGQIKVNAKIEKRLQKSLNKDTKGLSRDSGVPSVQNFLVQI
eukprot:NODE_19_length_47148_cov_1.447810.p16 type:complete len:330 gc:universal NODE_19_length_47148_cov_1.447810:5335-6324(+)